MSTTQHIRRLIIDVTPEQIAQYEHWTECVAFKLVHQDDGTVTLRVTNDLELITRPDGVA